jgi:hypothetical protein
MAMAHKQARLGLRIFLLIGVCLTLFSALPTAPAFAGVERNQDIDNTLAEFDDGSFQMAASANYPATGIRPGDTLGAVQMAPIAVIDDMDTITTLPATRVDAGVVALGRNIFAIGGTVTDTASNSVISSQVNQANGGLGAWQTDVSLPAVQHSARTGFTANTVSARILPAVAAYAKTQDSGFVYVLGGTARVSGFDISSYSVIRGTVVDGRITEWVTTLPTIPATAAVGVPIEGLTNASAAVATLPDGRTFLYLMGGLQVYRAGGITQQRGSRYIFSAQIDTNTGDFVGNAWSTTVATIPLNAAFGVTAGLWGAPIVGGNLRNSDGLTVISYYLMGGRYGTAAGNITSEIYRVDVSTSDGSVDTSQPSGVGVANASTGTARVGHAAIQFNGSVYVAGGISSGQSVANRNVLGSYIQPDRRFPDLDASIGQTYFISKDTGLPAPRSGHGLVVVPESFSGATKAYVYMIGGTDGSASSDNIFRTVIGDPNDTTVSYPLEGYYFSKVVPFIAANARLKRIYWAADIPDGSGIEISYRLSNDANCEDLGKRTESEAPWTSTTTPPGVAFDPVTNLYSYLFTSALANCFQYRAKFTPTNQSSANATPYLNRLGIVIEIPGATDLTVKTASFRRSGDNKIVGFNITLRNENIFLVGEPTLAADFGADGPGSAPGSLFVDIFIYPAGVALPPSHKPPTVGSAYAAISLDVYRNELQAGPSGTGRDFTIPTDRLLCDYITRSTPPYSCSPRLMTSLFPTAGEYQLVVVVDGEDNVVENPTAGGQAEDNNVFGPVTLTVAPGEVVDGGGGPARIALPIISGQ